MRGAGEREWVRKATPAQMVGDGCQGNMEPTEQWQIWHETSCVLTQQTITRKPRASPGKVDSGGNVAHLQQIGPSRLTNATVLIGSFEERKGNDFDK